MNISQQHVDGLELRIRELETELSAHSTALMNMHAIEENRWAHCCKYGWPNCLGLVHGGSTWRAQDAKGNWWAGNTPMEAVDSAITASTSPASHGPIGTNRTQTD